MIIAPAYIRGKRSGYVAHLGEVKGLGKTKGQAREDALARAETALTGYYYPRVVVACQTVVVVWRTPDGYGYTFHDAVTGRDGPSLHGCDSLDDAERRARYHLAQTACDPWQCTNAFPCKAYDLVRDERDRKEHLRYAAWQRGCKIALDKGLSDEEARAYADAYCRT